MNYWIECIGHDPMNRWNCGPLTAITVDQRYGDKHPRVYVTLPDGSEDVIDPAIWTCRIYTC